jgi:4-aminobutyrate aminotransferase/(S)-3-amino-2-methylpropionate transaminase
VQTGGLGGTYAGNPVACEAALAVFELLDEGSLVENAARIETAVRAKLEPLLMLEGIADVRGRGAMMAIEFGDASGPRGDLAAAAAKTSNAHGVVTLACGTNGNVIRLLPPLGIEADILSEGLAVLEASIRSVLP